MKKIDIITLLLVVLLFGGVACANLFQTDRPTESIEEKRTLQTLPEFSWENLADGTYFSEWALYVSDTFIGRETLVSLAKKMDTFMGTSFSINGEDTFVLLQSGNKTEDTGDLDNRLEDAFAQLESKQPETNPAAEETEPATAETEAEETIETTEAPETTESETTEDPETTEPETETEPAETEPVPEYDLKLSRETLQLTIGSGAVVYATVSDGTGESVPITWSISDKSIATIAKNPKGGLDVKGVAEGTCTLTCRTKEGNAVAVCTVTVKTVSTGNANEDAAADFMDNGLFIFGDAVYTGGFYSDKNAKYYAQTAAYYKTLFGENTRMNIVVAPVSAVTIDNPEVKKKITDQQSALDKMAAHCDASVNFVDTYDSIYGHRDEYLYFKSDHHWTGRGAYYAYAAYAESIGLTPTPLDQFDYSVINDDYHGSMYSFTKDDRVLAFRDSVEVFMPRKEMTMTITTKNGTTATYDSCILEYNKNYLAFIGGDNPYTVINVPENPQDFNVLVLKDSFGNAFIPYLCEHYGNIIVVDTRYTDLNVYEHLKDYGLSDIIFMNNIEAANNSAWANMYLKAVGVE
ncbi:MAG: hypothetical protein IJ325_10180 [Clostridia bacterium]|nr:hypothetical protein [Clostridia bacterium]